MIKRIGYLVPEFPGQTHIFFWRELQALANLGIEAEVISTRRPDAALISHDWSERAMKDTVYLFPPRLDLLLGGFFTLFFVGPRGWWRCLHAVSSGAGSFFSRLRRLPLILAGAEVAWLARKRGWHHLHAHSCANACDVLLFSHLLTRIPYSLTLHGNMKGYGPNQAQKWQNAAFAIVITKKLRAEVVKNLEGSLPPTIAVAPMGVDIQRLQRSGRYVPWSGEGPVRIFCCGRLHPGKGHEDLIQAVALLRDKGIDVFLHVAGQDDSGTGLYRARLETLTATLALDDRVVFLGAVGEEVVRRELEAAHLFSLASHEEALGVAIMEAMAMGTPVVVSDGGGGVTELVDADTDGLLFAPRDVPGMAKQIHNLLKNPELAVKFSHAGRHKIERGFHSGISAAAIAKLLREESTVHPVRSEASNESETTSEVAPRGNFHANTL